MSAVVASESVKLSPQQGMILAQLRAAPGSNIRSLHSELRIPYECVRTGVYVLLRRGLIERRGHRPLSLSSLFPVDKQAS